MKVALVRLGELPAEYRGEFTTALTNRRGLVVPPRDVPAHPDGVRVGLEALVRPAGQDGVGVATQTGLQTTDPNDPWPVERWLHRAVLVRPGWDSTD